MSSKIAKPKLRRTLGMLCFSSKAARVDVAAAGLLVQVEIN